jgi:hypothetical protein
MNQSRDWMGPADFTVAYLEILSLLALMGIAHPKILSPLAWTAKVRFEATMWPRWIFSGGATSGEPRSAGGRGGLEGAHHHGGHAGTARR